MDIETGKLNDLKRQAEAMESGLGAVAWAVLEMFRRGGMPMNEIKDLHDKMNHYFAKSSNEECNAVLKVLESRLIEEKASSGVWYS